MSAAPAITRRLAVTAIAGSLLAFTIATARAEPRALLIGVGDYKVLDADLIGIDLDIDMMTDVALRMGYERDQIKTLLDSEATLANIQSAMTSWLRDGVAATDDVLIYFSGHGTRVTDADRDEEDGVDEVFLPHDAYFVDNARAGEPALGNTVVDDRLGEWLAAIPSRNVIVLLDSCHSGTATRSFRLRNQSVAREGQAKFLHYGNVPKGIAVAPDDFDDSALNYVALSAARDDQQALGSASGGYFTLGVHRSVEMAARDKRRITLQDLKDAATEYIAGHVDEARVYQPTLSGRLALAERALPIEGTSAGHGPRWADYAALAAGAEPLKIAASKSAFKIGDALTLAVDVPATGYLNVLSIDAEDKTTVLFPNEFNPTNFVAAAELRLPTPEMTFDLIAAEPRGPTLIVAILTEQPINAYELAIEGRDELGVMRETFGQISARATRAFRVVQRTSRFSAGTLDLSVE